MAATMALSLTACGSSEKPAETAAPGDGGSSSGRRLIRSGSGREHGEQKALEGKKVGFAQTDSMSAWRTTETDSIKEYVENAGGEFIVKDAGGDIATQESDIRDLVAAGVDYLVVAPLENNGLQGALQEAMESNIPVILVDRAIDGEAGTHYTTAIMSDFIWEGEQCAKKRSPKHCRTEEMS